MREREREGWKLKRWDERKKERNRDSEFIRFVLFCFFLMILWVSKRKRKSEKLKIMKKEEIGNLKKKKKDNVALFAI